MSILLDGGSNPSRVVYNGTELRKVVFNGTTVWGGDYPASLSGFSLKTPGNDWFPNGFTFSAASLGYGEMQNRTAEPYQCCVYGDGFRGSGAVTTPRMAFKLPSVTWRSMNATTISATALSNKQGAPHLASGACTVRGVPSGFELTYLQVWAYANLPYTSGQTTGVDEFMFIMTYYGPKGGIATDEDGDYYVRVQKPSSLSGTYVSLSGTGASFSVVPTRFHAEILQL